MKLLPQIPLTLKRQQELRAMADSFGFGLRFLTGRSGRLYAIAKGGGGYAGYTSAMLMLDPVMPRLLRERGGMIDGSRWEQLLWCDPPDDVYLKRLDASRGADHGPVPQ